MLMLINQQINLLGAVSYNLNTSHVNVNLKGDAIHNPSDINLNTSHVNVNQEYENKIELDIN